MHFRFGTLFLVASTWMLASCSSSSSGGSSGDGGSGPQPGSVNCDPAPNLGTTVQATAVAGAPPAMTGGTIVDGTYVTTGLQYFNGASASGSHKETLIFANGTVKNIQSINGKPDLVLAGTYATSGNTLTFNITCPQSASVTATYTATPTQLMFITADNQNKLETWTKQ